MPLLMLISAANSLIIPIPTSSLSQGIFGHWQTINLTVDNQVIKGCFFDFIASDTYLMSKQYCFDRKCSFNSMGFDIDGKQLRERSTIQPGDINVARIESNVQIGQTTIKSPILVGIQSKLNWACRIGFGTRESDSNLVQQLVKQNLLDSNVVSYYSIKVPYFDRKIKDF